MERESKIRLHLIRGQKRILMCHSGDRLTERRNVSILGTESESNIHQQRGQAKKTGVPGPEHS